MAKLISKRSLKWIIPALAVLVIAFLGFKYWMSRKSALPPGIVSGNGRIEAKLVDIAAKEPLRVAEIRVNEGDLVKPGQVVALMDVNTLKSQQEEAKLNVVATQEKGAVAQATI